jgi:predicted nucleotidyltransferase component of viral defense system
MINRAEIESMAARLDVDPSHVQRDYVHSWLLSAFYTQSKLARQLVLKGGNCLRKAYFTNGRYSRDLDFSTSAGISCDELGREFNAVCATLRERAGIKFDLDRTRVQDKRGADADKIVSEARLYFEDFYGEKSELVLGVKLDVTQFDRLYLPIQERKLIHPYSDAEACTATIRCVKLEEALATKMRCLLQRRHIADLYDLAYPLVKGDIEVDRSELTRTLFRITTFGRSPGIVKGLHLDLPIEAMGRFWDRYISCPDPGVFSFTEARESLASLVNALFPGVPIREWSPVFFPARLRNPIMQAADSQTLLRLRYSGVDRLVEPYSLTFKTKKDGNAGEYLYAYDTTGGRSSGPRIKSFVPGKVQAAENTDVKFEPRFEIELKKAGGAETVGRFESRRTGWGRSRRTRRDYTQTRTNYNYELECPLCLRRFRRTQPDLKLRAHKDKYGNECYGRRGYFV